MPRYIVIVGLHKGEMITCTNNQSSVIHLLQATSPRQAAEQAWYLLRQSGFHQEAPNLELGLRPVVAL